MKRVFTFVGLTILATLGVFAQNQSTNTTSPGYFSIDWDRTFGGNQLDILQRILPAPNGDYLLAGISWSPVSGDKTNIIGGTDYWIVRIDKHGNKVWDKSIGGRYSEYLYDAIVARDGGYLLGGYSESDASGDKSENNIGGEDFWIIKINNNGDRVWDRTIGSSGYDHLRSLIPTSDGGYLLGGESSANASGDKSEDSRGGRDYWIVKTDKDGNIQWDKTIGGSGDDFLTDIIHAPDGNFLLIGRSSSNISAEKSENSKGGQDYWIVKIDKDGNKLWDKTFGGNKGEYLSTAVATPEGGYLLVGNSNSDASGDKSQDQNSDINYKGDFWIVKINSEGVIQWEKTIGGRGGEFPTAVLPTSDHSYLIGGSSDSHFGIDKSEDSRGGTDFWLVEIDNQGNVLWDKTIGGDNNELINSIVATPEGGYLLGGRSESNQSGEKSENGQGDEDYWIVKIDAPKLSMVTDLTLIDAKTDQDLQELQDGDILVLADLPTRILNIRANVVGQVESVRLELEGPLSRNMLDNGNPYALFGNNGPDYLPGNFPPGDYTLTVTPYSKDDAMGQVGEPLTIRFKVVRYSTITSLTLVNAETDQDLQELQDGDVLDLTALPTQQLNVRADVVGQVESVRLKLDGPISRNMLDNGNPYALFGNNGPDYLPGNFLPGHYTLKVIPYSKNNARGRKGTPLTIQFEVEPALAVVSFMLVNAETDEDIRELIDRDVIVSADVPIKQLNIRAEVIGPVESVYLQLERDKERNMLDNGNPYTLFGNNGPDYLPGELPFGNYILTATPYYQDDAMGQAGTPARITFSVVRGYYPGIAREEQSTPGKSSQALEGLSADAKLVELKEESLNIYPNPARAYVEVDLPLLKDQSYQLQMYDIYGRLVFRSLGAGHITESISLEDKPAGTYLIAVESQGKRVVRKLLIDK